MRSKDLLTRCRTLYEGLDLFLDGELPKHHREAVKGHLQMCPP